MLFRSLGAAGAQEGLHARKDADQQGHQKPPGVQRVFSDEDHRMGRPSDVNVGL